MLDLDIGMNEWLCEPFTWDDTPQFDRGKVMTAEELEAGKDFGRYLDVDGDGIPYRTYPGTHPDQGRLFHPRHLARPLCPLQRGRRRSMPTTCSGCCASSRPPRTWCRAPLRRNAAKPTKYGVIYFGSTAPAMDEALGDARSRGPPARHGCACAAFPSAERDDFIAEHEQVFVVEQNRDAQLRSLIMNECGIDPARLMPSCTMTARRSPPASSPARSPSISTRSKSRRC